MKLWMALYAMIWIVFIEFLLVMTPGGSAILIYMHIVLGVTIIGLAFYNFSRIRKTRVMGRVKRIAQTSFYFSVAVGIFGVLIFFDIGKTSAIGIGVSFVGDRIFFDIGTHAISIYEIILFFHVISAFAIITQAAAIAIAYDMWEDKEFVKETEPGIVPPMQAWNLVGRER